MNPQPTIAALALAILVGPAVAANPLDYPSVWECDQEKSHWYCDEDKKPAAKPQRRQESARPQPAPKKPGRIEIADLKTAEEMRLELKRREDLVVMNPTEAGMKDYLELWQAIQDKGSEFADVWRRVIWQNPSLDYSQRRPSNNSASFTFKAEAETERRSYLANLAKQHGLIFFFRSDCPYCKAMAPLVQQLASEYGFDVLPVSIDGRGIDGFPRARDGTKIAAAWGVQRVPALFVGSKETGDKAAIGFGQLSFEEIVERLYVLTGTKPGERF